MKRAMIVIAAAVLLCLVAGGSRLADAAPIDSLNLVSPGNIIYDGVYVSPYEISVTPVNPTGPPSNQSLICDNYNTEIATGAWTAYQYTISSASSLASVVTASDLKFATQTSFGYINSAGKLVSSSLSSTQAYEEMFYLSEQMALHPSDQIAISYALWEIAAPNNAPTVPGDGTTGSNADQTTSAYWLNLAQENYGGVLQSGYEFIVYTPEPLQGSSQEFIEAIHVPEPSSLLFLGVSLLMIAGAVSLKVSKTRI